MKSIERAIRDELKALGPTAAASTLAKMAIGLAKRLDADPGDDARTRLNRELRLTVEAVHRQSGGDVVGDVERFLERISNPSFRGPED